jgi:hypothetical protein
MTKLFSLATKINLIRLIVIALAIATIVIIATSSQPVMAWVQITGP